MEDMSESEPDYGVCNTDDLLKACAGGDLATVKQMIHERRVPVNSTCDVNCTALMYATMGKQLAVVNFLIDHRADVNQVDDKQTTALMFACDKSDIRVVRALLKAGARVDDKNYHAHNALSSAVHNNFVAGVRALIKARANVNIAEFAKNMATPLMFACEHGHDQCVRLLLKGRAQLDLQSPYGTTALMCATLHCRGTCVRILLEANANPDLAECADYGGFRPLMCACRKNDLVSTKALLKHRADINATTTKGSTSLMLAIEKSNVECVRLLLENGADVSKVNGAGFTPLIKATNHCDQAVLEMLIDKKADPNQATNEGETPLAIAVCLKSLDKAGYLIQKGSNLNSVCYGGATPLILATKEYRTSEELAFVSMLIDKRADLNARTVQERTPLQSACRHDNVACASLLLEAQIRMAEFQADLRWHFEWALWEAVRTGSEACTRLLCTSDSRAHISPLKLSLGLIDSCNFGYVKIMRVLLEEKADVNYVDVNHYTALMHACQDGYTQCARILVEAGADPEITSFTGETALDIAAYHEEFECRNAIRCLINMRKWRARTRELMIVRPIVFKWIEIHANKRFGPECPAMKYTTLKDRGDDDLAEEVYHKVYEEQLRLALKRKKPEEDDSAIVEKATQIARYRCGVD